MCAIALLAMGAYQYRGLLGFSRSSADVGSSSELSLSQCDNSICARNATTSVPLATFNGYGYDCQTADKYRSIGDYTGDGQEEAYFLYCNQSGDRTLFIVDFAMQSVIATSAVPREFDSYSMFVGSTKDPESKLHPYLANGYGDGGAWGYLCVFRPDVTNKNSNDTCGTGFVRIETKPTGQLFRSAMYREIGAYSQDLDHDGWEDINLIYHWGIVTVSPKTLGYVNETMYDVALADEPTSPLGFHSGRNYGIHNSFSYNNTNYSLIIGGVPIRTYHSNPADGPSDTMCNVSRFVAVLAGDASSRKLAWSDYYGFHSNIFGSYTTFDVQRYGDFQNGCIHYFNKQLLDLANKKVIVFNVFDESTPIDRCLPEQQNFYSGVHAPWNACVATNMKSPGRWSLVVKDLLTGTDLARFPNYYALGVSGELLAGKPQAFVAVKLPSTEKYPFDISLVSERTHVAFTISDTLAIELETPIPEDALPQITYAQSRDNKSYGSLNNGDVILTLPQGKYPLSATCTAPTISAGFGSDPQAIGATIKTARTNESVQIAWTSTGTLPLPGTLRSTPAIPTHANSYGIPENSTFTSPSGWYQFSAATPGTYKITFSSTSSCGPVTSTELILTVTATEGSTQDTTSGDLDSDGDVDIFDYNALVTNFGQTGQGGWIPADINKNGTIDIFDYTILIGLLSPQ